MKLSSWIEFKRSVHDESIAVLSYQRTLCSWSVVIDEFYQKVSYIAITGFHAP